MPLQQSTIIYRDTSYPHYYLCNYLPVSVGTDPLSLSLLKFKRGRQPDLNAWIDCALELMAEATIPPNTILLRALHHDETIIRDNNSGALDKLGKTLAAHFQSHYCPRLLRKSSPTPEIKSLPKEQRIAELKNRYHIDPRYLPSQPLSPSFLLLDDILTTGTTLKMIIGALLHLYPQANIVAFTLAKADYDNNSQPSPLNTHNYSIDQISNPTLAEEETHTYVPRIRLIRSCNILKNLIRENAFTKYPP
ncbi:MAG TPA: hypothetical protein VNS58_09505 [Puia sp.]|nr:hypothetical protein [Puia sp.]